MNIYIKIATSAAIISVAVFTSQAYAKVNYDIINLKKSFYSTLKDYSSAKFMNVHTDGDGFFCGSVNSKNSYGGYTGWQPFIATRNIDKSYSVIIGSDDITAKVFIEQCENMKSDFKGGDLSSQLAPKP